MSEKRDSVNSSDNEVKSRSLEEREHIFSDDVEEKSTFEKLKENKKVRMSFFAVLITGLLVFLIMPSKEKEELVDSIDLSRPLKSFLVSIPSNAFENSFRDFLDFFIPSSNL